MAALRTALVATAVALSAAPAAAALPAGRSGLYGGGAVRDYLQLVSAQIRPDGRFTAHATLVTKCSLRFGDQLTESVSVRGERLSPAGNYAATTGFEDDVEPGVQTIGGLHAEGTIAFSMRVLARGRATGEIRVRTTYTDPATGQEVARCDTGRIAVTLRRPLPDAGAGRASLQPGTHRGTTGQGEPFLARLTKRGRLVRRAGLLVRVGCPSGTGLPLDVVAHRIRVRRGRFGRRGVRGTFALDGVVRRDSDGAEIGSCTTGPIAWRALR